MSYISNSTIEKIFAECDIEDIVGHYIDLKKKGTLLEACCPFHDEKTPSFVVNPSKGIFKCFGCGKGGNSFQFVQLYKNYSVYETYVELANILNINIEYREDDREYKEKREIEISQLELLRVVAQHWSKELSTYPEINDQLEKRNVTQHDVFKWQLGFASNRNEVTNRLSEIGKIGEGLKLNLVTLKNGNHYDYFFNRIIIPIYDIKGNIIAFGGKTTTGEKAKYINSTTNEIYNKSATLYGLFQNDEAIRKRRKVYLLEGYFDVISLCRANINHVVGSCGTAFTDEQAKLLKKRVQNIVLFYDGDKAGRKASVNAMNIALKHGLNVQIVTDMPDGCDPDDLVQWAENCLDYYNNTQPNLIDVSEYWKEFEAFIEDNTVDALTHYAEAIYDNAESSYQKGEAIEKIAQSISYIANLTTKQEYIKEICDLIAVSKTVLKKEVDSIEKDRIENLKKLSPDKAKNEKGPQTDEARDDFRIYGFWADERQAYYGYHFSTKEGTIKVSNFLLESLYLIISQNDAKRIFRIKNDNNVERIMELPIDALTGLSKFQTNVEKLGKFIFEGSQSQVNKLKHKLYNEEKSCYEIKNLGWHKAKFWAFANGIFFDNEFHEIDNHGIVIHNDINYFIPALSKIYSGEDSYLKNDKKFIHIKKSKAKFSDWAKLYTQVYNYTDHYNGDIAILFAMAALFRDVIFPAMGNTFPLLFLFGPPGTGKNQLAYGILSLFGVPQDLVNLNSNTKPGISKRMAEYSNSIIFLDEFNNGLEDGTIQFLKSVFDGQSRTKSELTADDKTTSTPIRSSAIVAGQEKPISSGGALFSRSIFLQFIERVFNKDTYILLNEMQKNGITSVLLEIVSHRNKVENEFKTQFEIGLKKMHQLIDAHNIERRKMKQESIKIMDRLVNSFACLLAINNIFQSCLDMPFTTEEIEITLFYQMKKQSGMISKSNDVSIFWEVIQTLYYSNSPNKIEEGKHFKIADRKIDDKTYSVLYLQFSSVHMLYQKEFRQSQGKAGMDKSSLMDYLKNTPEYLGQVPSWRFTDENGKTMVNSAYMFDYDKLSKSINLVSTKDFVPDNIGNNDIKENKRSDENNQLEIPNVF